MVTGFGWQAGAPITLSFHEMLETPSHPDIVISTFADDGGVIDTSRGNTPDDDFQLDGMIWTSGISSRQRATRRQAKSRHCARPSLMPPL